MQMWIAWPFLLYLGERLYGLFRAESWDTQVVGASILDPGVLTLELTKPPGFTYKCACCPTVTIRCICICFSACGCAVLLIAPSNRVCQSSQDGLAHGITVCSDHDGCCFSQDMSCCWEGRGFLAAVGAQGG